MLGSICEETILLRMNTKVEGASSRPRFLTGCGQASARVILPLTHTQTHTYTHKHVHLVLARHGVLGRHHEEQRRDAGALFARMATVLFPARMRGPARHERT